MGDTFCPSRGLASRSRAPGRRSRRPPFHYFPRHRGSPPRPPLPPSSAPASPPTPASPAAPWPPAPPGGHVRVVAQVLNSDEQPTEYAALSASEPIKSEYR